VGEGEVADHLEEEVEEEVVEDHREEDHLEVPLA